MSSIQRRLILGLAATCSLLWGAGGIALYLVVRTGLVAESDDALKANAQTLITLTSQASGQFEFDFASELMPAFGKAGGPGYFQLWLSDGSTWLRSPSLGDANLPRSAGAFDSPRFWNLVLPDGRAGRAVGVHFVPQQDDEAPDPKSRRGPPGEVTLVVARHRAELDQRLSLLGAALLLVGATICGGTVLVVAVAVRRGLRPLAKLAEHAAAIDASSLQLRFPTDAMPAELLPIGRRLNDLLSRLEASFARERRFSADVAHELRTPITELRSMAEVALKWPDDVAGTTRAVEDALAIAVQMESIATRLLALARCEAGKQPMAREIFDLRHLLQERWRPLAPRADARRLEVAIEIPEELLLETDRAMLAMILDNILANAVEHTPPGGSVRVRVGSADDQFVTAVANTADGLGPDDLPHLFDRFWRKDTARSGSDHCGLGLSLAKAFADRLGLTLRADLEGGPSLVVSIQGPTKDATRSAEPRHGVAADGGR